MFCLTSCKVLYQRLIWLFEKEVRFSVFFLITGLKFAWTIAHRDEVSIIIKGALLLESHFVMPDIYLLAKPFNLALVQLIFSINLRIFSLVLRLNHA